MRKVIYSVLGVLIIAAVAIAIVQTRDSESVIDESNNYIYSNKNELEDIITEEVESYTDILEEESVDVIQGTLDLSDTNSSVEFEEYSTDYTQTIEQVKADSIGAGIKYDPVIYSDDMLLHDTVASVYMYSKQTGDILNSLVTQLANKHNFEVSVYAIINESNKPELDGYDFILMNEENKETYKVIYYYDCNEMCGYIVE